MQETVNFEKPRCSKCGSTQVYSRKFTGEVRCFKCGNVEKVEEDKKWQT